MNAPGASGIGGYPAVMPGYQAPPPAPEHKRAHLYIGNLAPDVTEYMLQEIFSTTGPVLGVKIIPDRHFQHGGLNYGFVEFVDLKGAETAIQVLDGRRIFDTEIKVNWAYQNQQAKEDLSGHWHVFVGDLSPEVNDEILRKTFQAFGTLSDARCMWDMTSGKSRGYGFLAFRDRTDAEQAIATMNGEWLGSRAIRVNWANQKNQQAGMPVAPGPGNANALGMGGGGGGGGPGAGGPGGPPPPPGMPQPPMGMPVPQSVPTEYATPGGTSYEIVVAQSSSTNTTVYVGNLVPFCNQADLIPLFQNFGYITEIRMQADRGFAFVKLDTHQNAAMAITNLNGTPVHGRTLRCSWGKDAGPPGAGGGGGHHSGPGGPGGQGAPAAGAAPVGGAAPAAAPGGAPAPSGGPQEPTPEALAYANQYANGDPALIQSYAQYYMEQQAQFLAGQQQQK